MPDRPAPAPAARPEGAPNVILICVDQWRGDCLSVAGHPVVETPYLDQLALRGARFTRAYTATPSCIPARAALMTGLSQRAHGRVGYRDGVPWDYETTLAGEFTRHGYQTQAIGKMHVYPERTQLGFQNVILHDGFVHYARRRERDFGLIDDYLPWLRQRAGADADYFDHGVNCNSVVARPWDKPEALHPTNWVVTQAIDFLRRRDPRKPFLLYLSFHRPHPPYDPPAWAFEQFLDAPMPDPPVGDWADLYAPYAQPFDPQSPVGAAPPRTLRRARAGYYGVEGRSLLPAARSGSGAPPEGWRPHLHGEHTTLGQALHWVTDGHQKYVWLSGAGREQLFDLDADPQERHDLARPGAGAGAAGCARWRDVLTQALAGRPEGFVRDGRLVPGRPVRALLTE